MKRKSKGNRRIIVGSIIGLLVVALGIALYIRPQKINYTEVKPVIGELSTNYSFSGSVEAKNRQTVLADKTMQINEIKVQEGEQVTPDTDLMITTMGEKMRPEISGEVTTIYTEENAQLMPGSKLADIVDYSDLQLKVQVDEYDLAAVSKDKEATITIHALDKDIKGKIIDVSKEGEYINGVTTFTATIALPNDNNLRVGMSAEAKVVNQRVSGVVLLPMSAIQFDENNSPFVLLKDGSNLPQRVSLTLGINDGVQVEIKSGVTANDTVLVPPAAKATGFGGSSQMRDRSDQTSQEAQKGGA
ncbi:hypothetical protein Desor_0624 [Desulfosporosinus orientis DSM 765]|uniref:Multidrug resistance protein MdtA-like C-terminal permuted SH3 domain-containing protein n=1 Tax=Desulfosporosinus orientis (strain ATCC 19365 / DSM 765 / NCIMB 8382 / VKM B-1628 / Singapore I) TaxID=768706 RepID=G7W591_DESOD|nr:HlyD family efflux transporter periplasmic adaptor subunit [Desulfosporosinus orientis]AET66319.1 hypothetical protein Desor_0624 [Desulfosporosinus orientis DSM 765]